MKINQKQMFEVWRSLKIHHHLVEDNFVSYPKTFTMQINTFGHMYCITMYN